MTNLKDYYGITITDPLFDENLEKKLATLALEKDNILARVVIDKLAHYEPLVAAFKMISKYVVICLQIADSFNDKQLSNKEYNERERWMKDNLAVYSPFIEISNEIGPSSDWLSGQELQRARNSAQVWRGFDRIVTYFWNYEPKQMKEYIANNVIPCEHKMISFYPRKQTDFKALELFLSESTVSGLSEFGFEQWERRKPSSKTKRNLIARAYEVGAPTMLWDWQEEAKF